MIPDWLEPVRRAAEEITVHHLTRFQPPEDGNARKGAVLMLFSEGESGRELLLTERAHDMRSHPGQVSFPGGSLDPGETPEQAALREADEEIGLDPASVEVFARLPELWLPPSNFAVTPVLGWWRQRGSVGIASRDEVHAVHHVLIDDLLDPTHRIRVRHPSGWLGPGFMIGENKDVILWGFTGGIIARLFDFLGWTQEWDEAQVRDLPGYMLQGEPAHRPAPNTRLLDIEDSDDLEGSDDIEGSDDESEERE